MVQFTPKTLKYMGVAQKVLDIGAAIQRIEELRQKTSDILKEYRDVSGAINDSYRMPGFDISSVLDRDSMNLLDPSRGLISLSLQDIDDSFGKLVDGLNEMSARLDEGG